MEGVLWGEGRKWRLAVDAVDEGEKATVEMRQRRENRHRSGRVGEKMDAHTHVHIYARMCVRVCARGGSGQKCAGESSRGESCADLHAKTASRR